MLWKKCDCIFVQSLLILCICAKNGRGESTLKRKQEIITIVGTPSGEVNHLLFFTDQSMHYLCIARKFSSLLDRPPTLHVTEDSREMRAKACDAMSLESRLSLNSTQRGVKRSTVAYRLRGNENWCTNKYPTNPLPEVPF